MQILLVHSKTNSEIHYKPFIKWPDKTLTNILNYFYESWSQKQPYFQNQVIVFYTVEFQNHFPCALQCSFLGLISSKKKVNVMENTDSRFT